MTDDLVAVCDLCLQAIADGEGALEVDTAAADRAARIWRERVGPDPLAVFRTTPGARPVAWTVRHGGCGSAPRFAYTIAVERVRSWTALLHWWTHLADKSWLPATDWQDLMVRALEPRQAAVSGILPSRPRDLRGGPIGDRPEDRLADE
ncbi:hypothetical protein [Streptomyces sp. RKAG337]|uniref:hypothetical protein n=1 Tax=Streptomyces sp. RKAG337 TaxID=2893404 RepID=UPI002033B29C|nr:hypothetical protein [Streptomyces sp. RKAG337]MCM2431066.1 hypothetical protein [Streptomyces sp. RKAG337]